jgi:hypothetical protein
VPTTRRTAPPKPEAAPSAAEPQPARPAPHRPEMKIGPFAGGIGVAVWLKTAATDDGPRRYRSITISPRRFRDRETGEWRDASAYFPGDIPALLLALQKSWTHYPW